MKSLKHTCHVYTREFCKLAHITEDSFNAFVTKRSGNTELLKQCGFIESSLGHHNKYSVGIIPYFMKLTKPNDVKSRLLIAVKQATSDNVSVNEEFDFDFHKSNSENTGYTKMTADEWFRLFNDFLDENVFNIYNTDYEIASEITDIIATADSCENHNRSELLNNRAEDMFADLLREHARDIALRFTIKNSKKGE